MNKNQHPNAAEALLNWTLTRADGRIVVQHSSGAFYAAAKEGGSGIAESILYLLAESLLSATISPADIGDGVDTSAWPACNPACDPEFNGHKSRHCTCAAAKAALSPLPGAVPAELTNVLCMCGDEYPHDSYGAGFIAGSGMCENCDAAIPAKGPPAAGVPEGYVLTPIKPTIEMVEAGYEASLGQPDRSAHARVIEQYDAMLAEAPPPPASEKQRTVGLDVIDRLRLELLPEYEAGYTAVAYGDSDQPVARADGMTAREAIAELLRLNPHLAKGEGE